jgi:DNA-binding transcriptional regulator PaaX
MSLGVHWLIFGTITSLDLAAELLNCLWIGQNNRNIFAEIYFIFNHLIKLARER